jgi:hypothetical protein
MGCPVVGPDSVDFKTQKKIDNLLSQELATKFEVKLLESGLGLGRKTESKKHFSPQSVIWFRHQN